MSLTMIRKHAEGGHPEKRQPHSDRPLARRCVDCQRPLAESGSAHSKPCQRCGALLSVVGVTLDFLAAAERASS